MEFKEILEQLDITLEEGAEPNAENFRKAFDGKFIAKDLIDSDEDIKSRITGKLAGTTATELNRHLKGLGIELTAEEKKLSLPELTKLSMAKISANIEKIKQDSSLNLDEKAKLLEENLTKIKAENEAFKSMAESKNSELESLKSNYEQQLQNFKINTVISDIKAGIPFSKEIGEVAKIGFDTLINSKYNFSINDNGEISVTDKNGQPIKNEKNTGLATAKEVFLLEAKNNNLIANSNPPQTAGKPAGNTNKMMPPSEGAFNPRYKNPYATS